jgi:hypothetical protein
MKQILLVLAFTALVALSYVVVRELNEPGGPAQTSQTTPAGGRTGPIPQRAPQAPSLSADEGRAEDDLAAAQAELGAKPLPDDAWHQAASADLVVPAREQWWPDLSSVDFSADPVFAYEGGEVTQLEFRRAVCSWLAAPLLEASAAVATARAEALAAGLEPIELDQALLDRRFEIWCEDRGVDLESGALMMGLQYRLPAPAARRLYDLGGQLALTNATSASRDQRLLEGFLTGLASEQVADVAEELVGRVRSQWEAVKAGGDGAEEAFRATLVSLDQLAVIRVRADRGDAARRAFTAMDHDLPDDVVLGVAGAEVPEGGLPWESGDTIHIPLDDIWSLLEGQISPVQLERVLREYLFVDVLKSALATEDRLESDDEAWRLWIDAYDEMSRTALGAKVLNIELLGFPSLDVYRPIQRMLRSFERGQGSDWRSEEELREFHRGHRMFIEAWSAMVTLAYFPAVAPDAPFGATDWVGARAEAEAMLAEVAAGGDFSELVRAHSQRLARAYAESRGEAAGAGFSQSIGRGVLSDSINQIGAGLRLDYYQRLVHCGGSFIGSLIDDEVGMIHGPLLSPLGYYLFRVDRVALPGLEREYEDGVIATKQLHRDYLFSMWANARLRAAGFTAAD